MSNQLKQLSKQEQDLLKQLIEQVQNIKKSHRQSLKSQLQQNQTHLQSQRRPKKQKLKQKPLLFQCQADNYIKMCFLMLRQALYGKQTIKKKEISFKTIIKYLRFYNDTYIMKQSSKQQKNITQKIQIFEPIQKDILINSFQKLKVMKLQKLAQWIHQSFISLFGQFKIEQQLNKLKPNQQETLMQEEVQKKVTISIQIKDALKYILDQIETQYPWQSFDHQLQNYQLQNQWRQGDLGKLNVEAIDLLYKIQKYLDQLNQSQRSDLIPHIQPQQRQELQENHSPSMIQSCIEGVQKNQLKEKQKISEKLNEQQDQQNSSKQNKSNESQRQQKCFENSYINSQLKEFCQFIQNAKSQKPKIQKKYQHQKWTQILTGFNYGLLENKKLPKLGFYDLQRQIKSQEIQEYLCKREILKRFVFHVNRMNQNPKIKQSFQRDTHGEMSQNITLRK